MRSLVILSGVLLSLLLMSGCSNTLSVTYLQPTVRSEAWQSVTSDDGLIIESNSGICIYIEERLDSKQIQPLTWGLPFLPLLPWKYTGGETIKPRAFYNFHLMIFPKASDRTGAYTLDLNKTRLNFSETKLAPNHLFGIRECKEHWTNTRKDCWITDFSQAHTMHEAESYYIKFDKPAKAGPPISLEVLGLEKNGTEVNVPKIFFNTNTEKRYKPIALIYREDGLPYDSDYNKYTACKVFAH